MRQMQYLPSLVEQVHQAVVAEIASGKWPPGTRLIQEQIAAELGISRQPVQQVLALLRKQGVVQDAPGRGLIVSPLKTGMVKHIYDVRAALETMACREAALRNAARAQAEGPGIIRAGREAMDKQVIAELVAADMAFHNFIYELSENPFIPSMMETLWTNTQRVIGALLMHENKPVDVWMEHEGILTAIAQGNGPLAETLAREHIVATAEFMTRRLEQQSSAVAGGLQPQP